jgi:rhodanese-related sulfurtransferase
MNQLNEYLTQHPLLVAITAAAAAALLYYELTLSKRNQSALSPNDAVRLINQGAAVIDVRSSAEFANGHLSNARHLPAENLASAAESLKRFKDKPVLVYCERGGNAAASIHKLRALGFTQLFNLRGGLAAWRADNLPLVK